MKDELARAYFYKGEMYRLAGDMAKALFYEKNLNSYSKTVI